MKACCSPRKKSSCALLISIVAMAALCLLREYMLAPNPDSSWLLSAAQRVAAGERLYVDVMETNPPLIVWLNMLPVWISHVFPVMPERVWPLVVAGVNAISLWCVWRVLMAQPIGQSQGCVSTLMVAIAVLYFLCSTLMYGERELLFIALVVPYLMQSLGERKPWRQWRGLDVGVALMAMIGFTLKPFFLLLWGVNELCRAGQLRQWRSVFEPINWCVGLAQIFYVVVVYVAVPEYHLTVLPVLLDTYFTYKSEWSAIFSRIAIISVPVSIVALLAKVRGDTVTWMTRMVSWVLACALLMVVQRKEWINHMYPLLFAGGVWLALLLHYLGGIWKEQQLEIGHRRFSALCLAAMLLPCAAYIDGRFVVHMFKHYPSVRERGVVQFINEHAAGKEVYPFSYNLQSAFPLISMSQGQFHGAFHHLWPLAGLIIKRQEWEEAGSVGSFPLAKSEAFFFDTLVRDFSKHPPELVWVDENESLENIAGYAIAPANRSILAVLQRDMRFAVLWQRYSKIGEVEDVPLDDETSDEKTSEETSKEPPKKPARYVFYRRNPS